VRKDEHPKAERGKQENREREVPHTDGHVLSTLVVIGASSIKLEDFAGGLHCLRLLGVCDVGAATRDASRDWLAIRARDRRDCPHRNLHSREGGSSDEELQPIRAAWAGCPLVSGRRASARAERR
jgi:hypothetical protein